MNTNIYDIVSREIETFYPKYITLAYYYQRFPLIRDIVIDGQEEELYGYIQREGNNLVVTIENIGFDICYEPWRFEFPVYDEDDYDEDEEED